MVKLAETGRFCVIVIPRAYNTPRWYDDKEPAPPTSDMGRISAMASAEYETYYAVIRAIPPGRVMTYGDVAAYAGRPRQAQHRDHLQQPQLAMAVADMTPERLGGEGADRLRTQQYPDVFHAQAHSRRRDDIERQGHERRAANPLGIEKHAEAAVRPHDLETVG